MLLNYAARLYLAGAPGYDHRKIEEGKAMRRHKAYKYFPTENIKE